MKLLFSDPRRDGHSIIALSEWLRESGYVTEKEFRGGPHRECAHHYDFYDPN